MKSEKYEVSISYFTDGNGSWTKVIGGKQCSCESFMYGECQGESGHMGCHWNYQLDGSYAYWKNDKDPSAIEDNCACGLIPPDNDSYINPSSKAKENYRKFYTTVVIDEKNLIEQLEKGIPPEENASIDRPCTVDEIEELKRMGRIQFSNKCIQLTAIALGKLEYSGLGK